MGEGPERDDAARLVASSPLFSELLCETGSFSHRSNPCHSPQSALSLSFPLSQPLPCILSPHHSQSPWSAASLWFLSICSLTSLVVLVDCFFNSVVVRVPCSLIFWHFWLFIDFRLFVILLLVFQGREGLLPTPPSWPEITIHKT